MDKVNFQKIHYFIVVAEALNFTMAAQKLYISQPALSKQIRQLEEAFGVQLFDRNTKHVELTESGRILYHYCKDIYIGMEEKIEEAKALSANTDRRIRIGLLEMGGVIDFIMDRLEGYDGHEDKTSLEFFTYGFKDLKEKLNTKDLDMIFTINSELPKHGSMIVSREIANLNLCIVVPKKNPLSIRESLTIRDLRDKIICTFSTAYSDEARRSIIAHCQLEGFYPTKMKVYPNIRSMMIAMTTSGEISIGYKDFFLEVADKMVFYPVSEAIGNPSMVMAYRQQDEEGLQGVIDYMMTH